MAEKQTNKDRMREIVDSIENGIKELFESDKYRKYLATMSRFHRYSVNNTMLMKRSSARMGRGCSATSPPSCHHSLPCESCLTGTS